MELLVFESEIQFADLLIQKYSMDDIATTIVAPQSIIRNIMTELIKRDVKPIGIEYWDPGFGLYDTEYMLTVVDNELFVNPAKNEIGDYASDFSDVLFYHPKCSKMGYNALKASGENNYLFFMRSIDNKLYDLDKNFKAYAQIAKNGDLLGINPKDIKDLLAEPEPMGEKEDNDEFALLLGAIDELKDMILTIYAS